MTSEVKANKISPATGTALQISDSGDTTTIPSGATLDVSSATMTGFTIPSGQTLTVASGGTITNSGTATGFGSDNTPAFQAYISANQTLNHDTSSKVQFNTEDFDTDSAYDNSTNYRFTVPAGEGGKYFIYCKMQIAGAGVSTNNYCYNYIYLNGSSVSWAAEDGRNNPGEYYPLYNSVILTLVPTDYIEAFAYLVTTSGAAGALQEHGRGCMLGGYKMIGL